MAEQQVQQYEVIEDGFIAGDHHKAGDVISLEPRRAKYLTAPYGTRLRPVVARAKAPAAKAGKGKK